MVPSTGVVPRDGSFALACFGKVRNVHATLALDAGCRSVALKRIFEVVRFIEASGFSLESSSVPSWHQDRGLVSVNLPLG